VILKATAKSPDDRFGSVSEMNHALQAAIAHVRDPISHEAPTIELPPVEGVPEGPAPRRQWRLFRVAAAAAAGLLLILAVPVFASGLLDLLQRASSPAEGGLSGLELGQLTLQAGTIQAMSTEVARSQSDPEAIQTAVALTLAAAGPLIASETDGTSGVSTIDAAGTIESSLTPTVGLSAAGLQQAPSATPAPSALPSTTPAPGTSPSHTSTSRPGAPSATPSPTPTFTPTDTSQPATPTLTQIPVPTPVPTDPPTPIPTAVPTQNPCPLLDLGGFEVSGMQASWTISNDSSSTVVIKLIVLDWPAGNVELDRIRFDGSSIWNGSDEAPPSEINSGFTGNRSLDGGDSKALKFEFTGAAGPGGYDLQVQLEPGCQLSGGG
jgi:hypothetical protein